MPIISERDLSVFIALLSAKIHEMKAQLAAAEADEPTDEQTEGRVELQETLEQYGQILGTLREEYQTALRQGINLPSFETLTRAPGS
ncbi:MAG: hypothetical protein P8Y25_16065 [Chromatiaceae bacterium]